MLDGIISLIICCVVKLICNPYLNQYKQFSIEKGYDIVQVENSLTMFELALEILVFIIVYSIIKGIKHFIKKH